MLPGLLVIHYMELIIVTIQLSGWAVSLIPLWQEHSFPTGRKSLYFSLSWQPGIMHRASTTSLFYKKKWRKKTQQQQETMGPLINQSILGNWRRAKAYMRSRPDPSENQPLSSVSADSHPIAANFANLSLIFPTFQTKRKSTGRAL